MLDRRLHAARFCQGMDFVYDVAHSLWMGRSRAPRHEVLFYDGGCSAATRPAYIKTRQADCDAGTQSDQGLPSKAPDRVRVVCLSDTHERHDSIDVPAGDVLLLTGDLLTINRHFSVDYSVKKLEAVAEWLRAQPHPVKILIAGNHDHAMAQLGTARVQAIFHGSTYLEDSGAEIPVQGGGKLAVWGSPLSAGHSKNDAFQSEYSKRLAALPKRCDILLTHGPLQEQQLLTVAPRLHVCGHIHAKHGLKVIGTTHRTISVNASIMDGKYHPTQVPVVVDLPVSME